MKYDKYGVKEEDFSSIYPALSRKWRQTESEGEALKLEKYQNVHYFYIYCRIENVFIRFYHDLNEIYLWFIQFLCLPSNF